MYLELIQTQNISLNKIFQLPRWIGVAYTSENSVIYFNMFLQAEIIIIIIAMMKECKWKRDVKEVNKYFQIFSKIHKWAL